MKNKCFKEPCMALGDLPFMIDERRLADLLGVSVSKIRKDRLKGQGVTPNRIGRAVRYRCDNIIEYVNNTSNGASHDL